MSPPYDPSVARTPGSGESRNTSGHPGSTTCHWRHTTGGESRPFDGEFIPCLSFHIHIHTHHASKASVRSPSVYQCLDANLSQASLRCLRELVPRRRYDSFAHPSWLSRLWHSQSRLHMSLSTVPLLPGFLHLAYGRKCYFRACDRVFP